LAMSETIKKSDVEGWDDLSYHVGFSGEKKSEAIRGAVPASNVTPQKAPFGLYAEQLSGTAFTVPRVHNRRTWTYRIIPSCKHEPPKQINKGCLVSNFSKARIVPNQMRWDPLPFPGESTDFSQGLITYAGCGSAEEQNGLAIHLYSCDTSMNKKAMCNSDGDFLIVPQEGSLRIWTEMGKMVVSPEEMCIIPRGIKFSVAVDGCSRGYIAEIWGNHFVLPDLGPIGANGLANSRDFQVPNAAYINKEEPWIVIQKFGGELFELALDHCPFDVVGWCGNYYPVKYDLSKFVALNSVTVDHIDPSIFTVLTCPTDRPGVALCDFVIFPPRWSVHTNTFRPPYYHRNCMSEFMGNIKGRYEAKEKGFLPGGASLHSPMMGHGPDAQCFEKASNADLKPAYICEGALAFMFETCLTLKLTTFAAEQLVQTDYHECWRKLKNNFNPPESPEKRKRDADEGSRKRKKEEANV